MLLIKIISIIYAFINSNNCVYMPKKKEKEEIKFADINQSIDPKVFKETALVFFRFVPDPRVEDNCYYDLIELIIVMLLAIFCGANNIKDINRYSDQNHQLWKELFRLDFTPPSYDTFWWLLTRMCPKAFSKAFYDWVKDERIGTLEGTQINVDGKTLRGARKKKGNAVHIVHAWAHEKGILIGQRKTDAKSNEITAIPALLKEIDIHGATISVDAAGCQKKTIETIVDGGGEYFLAVKDNQPKLYNEMKSLFDDAHADDFEYVENADRHNSVEKGHGRIVKRSIATIGDVTELSMAEEWKNLQTLIEITTKTISKGQVTEEKRYYISSLFDSAKKFGERARDHWSVESTLHWTLDVVFKEDESRANTMHSAVNLGTLRRAVLNVIKSDPLFKKMGPAEVRGNAKWNKDGSFERKFIDIIFSGMLL